MKRIKLKNTFLCNLIVCLPVFLPVFLLFTLFSLKPIAFFICMLVGVFAIVYFIKMNFIISMVDLVTTKYKNWKKDRLWYVLDGNLSVQDIETAILARAKKHGRFCDVNSCTGTDVQLLAVQYKRYNSLTVFYSSYERTALIYKTDHLSDEVYNTIKNDAEQIVEQLKIYSKPSVFLTKKEREEPICKGIAVIILAACADFTVLQSVRKLPKYENTAIVPCVVELNTKKCYFDGFNDGVIKKTAKNFAIDVIRKIVFNNRLPVKDNPHFDLSRKPAVDPETPLFDFVKSLTTSATQKKELDEQTARSMRKNDVVEKDGSLYISSNGKVTVFPYFEEPETKSVEILIDVVWYYPKRQRISAAETANIKTRLRRHFANRIENFRFSDEEL